MHGDSNDSVLNTRSKKEANKVRRTQQKIDSIGEHTLLNTRLTTQSSAPMSIAKAYLPTLPSRE